MGTVERWCLLNLPLRYVDRRHRVARLRGSNLAPLLSETSARLLAELKAKADVKLCPPCAAARLKVTRWDALKSIRELVAHGEVACGLFLCTSCPNRELVAFLRPVPFMRAAPAPRRRVLIVDGAEDLRWMYAIFLRDEGFEVSMAPDGATGLGIAQLERPDIIVLDPAMPGMNGLEVIRRLKDDTRTRSIPILIVTALARTTDAQDALAAGASGCCMKPYVPEALLHQITLLLPQSG